MPKGRNNYQSNTALKRLFNTIIQIPGENQIEIAFNNFINASGTSTIIIDEKLFSQHINNIYSFLNLHKQKSIAIISSTVETSQLLGDFIRIVDLFFLLRIIKLVLLKYQRICQMLFQISIPQS